MSLHSDLLAQSRQLLSLDGGKPKQASLRRAISTVYYALFHLLIHEASTMLVSNVGLRPMVSRAFTHSEMIKTSRSFANNNSSLRKYDAITRGAAVPDQLQRIAKAFVELQEARHEADYNLAKSFTEDEVKGIIDQAEQAFLEWQVVRESEYAQIYLTALLLGDRIK